MLNCRAGESLNTKAGLQTLTWK